MEAFVKTIQETVTHVVELIAENDRLRKENRDLKDKIDKLQQENMRLTTNETIRKIGLEVEKEMRLLNK